MNTLHMMVGLPRSGKSSEALKMGYPIVCPDSIRLTIHGTPFYKDAEGLVWSIAKIMVKSLFKTGHTDVILDACNVTEYSRELWKNDDWNIKYHVFETSKSVCIKRAIDNNQEYLIPIIEKMSLEFEDVVEIINE